MFVTTHSYVHLCCRRHFFVNPIICCVISLCTENRGERFSSSFYFREYFVKYALNSTTEKKSQSQKYFSLGDYLIKKNIAFCFN